MSKNDGGPAYPVVTGIIAGRDEWDDAIVERTEHAAGMSLRDHFAGLALQGMLAANRGYTDAEYAKESYDIADDMLAAREAK
jgi:hypothetical protein